jgi:hypothetical protein
VAVGSFLGLTEVRAQSAWSWDTESNAATFSIFQDNIMLGGDGVAVGLDQLSLADVASQEGVGTALEYALTSVVLAIDGTVYGTIYFRNNGTTAVRPSFRIEGDSTLSFESQATQDETYFSSLPLGSVQPGATYAADVNNFGSGAESVSITDDLSRFLGIGQFSTMINFPVDVYFSSAGSQSESVIALQGSADVSVTYNYEMVPEPSTALLVGLGCGIIALRRRVAVKDRG